MTKSVAQPSLCEEVVGLIHGLVKFCSAILGMCDRQYHIILEQYYCFGMQISMHTWSSDRGLVVQRLNARLSRERPGFEHS